MGGVMGAGMRMMGAGLSMGQVQGVTRQFIAYAREKVGEDVSARSSARFPAFRSSFDVGNGCRAGLRGRGGQTMAYPITDIRGIGADTAVILKSEGIRTTDRAAAHGQNAQATAQDRREDRHQRQAACSTG